MDLRTVSLRATCAAALSTCSLAAHSQNVPKLIVVINGIATFMPQHLPVTTEM
jgi:hypothetical protein